LRSVKLESLTPGLVVFTQIPQCLPSDFIVEFQNEQADLAPVSTAQLHPSEVYSLTQSQTCTKSRVGSPASA